MGQDYIGLSFHVTNAYLEMVKCVISHSRLTKTDMCSVINTETKRPFRCGYNGKSSNECPCLELTSLINLIPNSVYEKVQIRVNGKLQQENYVIQLPKRANSVFLQNGFHSLKYLVNKADLGPMYLDICIACIYLVKSTGNRITGCCQSGFMYREGKNDFCFGGGFRRGILPQNTYIIQVCDTQGSEYLREQISTIGKPTSINVVSDNTSLDVSITYPSGFSALNCKESYSGLNDLRTYCVIPRNECTCSRSRYRLLVENRPPGRFKMVDINNESIVDVDVTILKNFLDPFIINRMPKVLDGIEVGGIVIAVLIAIGIGIIIALLLNNKLYRKIFFTKSYKLKTFFFSKLRLNSSKTISSNIDVNETDNKMDVYQNSEHILSNNKNDIYKNIENNDVPVRNSIDKSGIDEEPVVRKSVSEKKSSNKNLFRNIFAR